MKQRKRCINYNQSLDLAKPWRSALNMILKEPDDDTEPEEVEDNM